MEVSCQHNADIAFREHNGQALERREATQATKGQSDRRLWSRSRASGVSLRIAIANGEYQGNVRSADE